MPVGVGLHRRLGLRHLEFVNVLERLRRAEISLTRIGEVGGPAQEQDIRLLYLKEAGLCWSAQKMRLGNRDGLRTERKWRGFFTTQMSQSDALSQIEVRGLRRDLFLPHTLQKAMHQNGERG